MYLPVKLIKCISNYVVLSLIFLDLPDARQDGGRSVYKKA